MTHDSCRSDEGLADELYGALRTYAVRALGHGSRLDPTDLIHQAWVRLAHSEEFDLMPRPEFLALCATVMRRIAVDEGRRRVVERRGPEHITLSALAGEGNSTAEVDLLSLDEALRELEALDPRWARIVELRFFGGLTGEETASAMNLSRRTVVREWDLARAWLKRKLG
mgnify:CR=1 FL=1